MWVKFGRFAWPSRIVNQAQESHMRTPQCYNLSLEEVLIKYYSAYKRSA